MEDKFRPFYLSVEKNIGAFLKKMNTMYKDGLRFNGSCLAAGEIRALADMAGVTIDIYPFFHGGKIEVTGDNPVNAFVKKASDELFTFVEGGDYAPLHEAIEALKKRVLMEIMKIEGFVNEDYEFRFVDTNGITSVPVEDWKVLMRGRRYRLEPDPDDEEGGKFIAFPEL